MTVIEKINFEIALHTKIIALLQDTGANTLGEVRDRLATLTSEQADDFVSILGGIKALGGVF